MRKILFITVLLLVSISCATTKKEKKIITGAFSWNQWQKEAGWHDYTAENYEPGEFLTEQLNTIVNNENNKINFLLFAGSWCGDSESEVPKIYKLFTKARIPITKIKLYGVDRNKRESSGAAEKYKIERVPTLIAVKNGQEIGRIVEFPSTSWEEDIFKILIKS